MRPPIAFNDGYDAIPPDLEIELAPDDHDFALSEIWKRGLEPKLDTIAEPLFSIAVAHLTARHRTLRAWQKADHEWDPDSWGRHAIEPHEQDDYPKHVDVLIDVARGCLQWLADNRPNAVARWCGQLHSAQEPLLRRLSIHALFVRRDLAPEEKFDWLLSHVDLHDLAAITNCSGYHRSSTPMRTRNSGNGRSSPYSPTAFRRRERACGTPHGPAPVRLASLAERR